MKKLCLDSSEKELCRLIRGASIANHFAEERLQIDRKIGNVSGEASREQVLREVLVSIEQLVDRMKKEARADLTCYDHEDRELVQYTFLFELFHRFIDAFDEHILRQVEVGDSVLPVRFADQAFSLFRQRGFSPHDSVLYFSIFFQLRRAYFFIEKQLTGLCPSMQRLRTSLWNNIFTYDPVFYKEYLLDKMEDFSTLILGATGTGKGTAASAIGRSGFIPFNEKTLKFTESFTKAFVALNMSQFPEGVIESELFGHKKGAFTGAVEVHEGIFDTCSPHGSIFLDEIGDLSVPVQIKLLKVLQERQFSPVGSHEKKRFSGRVIAATNKDLSTLRATGLFRNDFYYRLCTDIITMPALSERIRESERELDLLIGHVVATITGKENPELASVVKTVIDTNLGKEYPWPGNVRELEQCVRRVIIRRNYQGDTPYSATDRIGVLVDEMRTESLSAGNLLSQYCAMLYKKHQSYETVRKIVQLDRRTVKRYIAQATETDENTGIFKDSRNGSKEGYRD